MADTLTFEQALERLEGFSEKMASPDITLDESIKLYTQSVKLISFCQKSLEEAKLKIESLEAGEDKKGNPRGEKGGMEEAET